MAGRRNPLDSSGSRRTWSRRGATLVVAAALAVIAVVVGIVAFVGHRDRRGPDTAATGSTSSLLVVTWGPSLCRVERSNPGCRSGHVGKLGPTLILHGLWPQPPSEQYCGLPKGQRDVGLPALNLPQDVQADLQSMMSDVAIMAPHEWKAHGSCSGVSPVEYFRIAASFAEQATRVLDPVFAGAAGGIVSLDAIRERFDRDLGPGAGQRVSLNCRPGQQQVAVAYEVRISLPPVADLQTEQKLADVIAKGPPVSAGCRRGSVSG